MTGFVLHPRLAADTHTLGQFPLCVVLLMNDARFPWTILVPRREGLREVYELGAAERSRLWEESDGLARAMMQAFRGDKFNLAALGNQVPQLHIHHVVRHAADAAWPRPVWGVGESQPYDAQSLRAATHALLPLLGRDFEPA